MGGGLDHEINEGKDEDGKIDELGGAADQCSTSSSSSTPLKEQLQPAAARSRQIDQFVGDGDFLFAKLNEEVLNRELDEDGSSGGVVHVRITPMRTEIIIIIRATGTTTPPQNDVLGEKGRELITTTTSVVHKMFIKFPEEEENSVELLYAEKVNNRGLCVIGPLLRLSSSEVTSFLEARLLVGRPCCS